MREMEMINSSAATVVGSGKESDANDHAEGEGAVSAIITSDVNGNGVEGDAECATTEQQASRKGDQSHSQLRMQMEIEDDKVTINIFQSRVTRVYPTYVSDRFDKSAFT